LQPHDTDNHRPRRLHELATRVAATRQEPIYTSSYALLLTTGTNALLGLAFWVAAARLYPEHVVGLGAGGISSLQLVALVGWVGLQFTLLRYVPVAGSQRPRLVALVYGAGVAAALAVTVVFALAFADALHVPYVGDSPLHVVAFGACVAAWVVFSLQDAVLVGIRRAFLVPAENAVYGLLKLFLLIGLSQSNGPWTLLGVWAGATAAMGLAVNGLLFRRLLAADGRAGSLPPTRGLVRFSSGHTAVALTAWLPDFLVPLLVLSYLDQAANAYYFVAWTVGFSARLLAMNLANALTVEGAYAENPVSMLVRSVVRLSLTVLLPVMTVLLLAAKPVLSVFGQNYADHAAPLLRLFALSLIPYTIATLAVAFDRVYERFGTALAITAVGTVATIGLDMLLIPHMGISGAGVGWLAGQTLAAAVAIVLFVRTARRGERAGQALPLSPPRGSPPPEAAETLLQ
jgi:O-antigen/teichoic acid export membrane protein